MSITITKDGFDGTISSSNGDIFIKTQNNSGSINIGTQLELTGSKVIEKDFDGNIRQVKVYNVDGSIAKRKFDKSTGKVIEEKFKDIALGKEYKRSGSNSTDSGSTDNQIEFQQNSAGAFISVSGSNPGFNVINSPRKSFRLIRETQDQFVDLSNPEFNLWTNGIAQTDYTSNGTNIKSGSFVFSGNTSLSNAILILSESGDVRIPGNLYAQEYHTEMVSSSVIYSSGSTQFGNSHDDTHTFTGAFLNAITASGNISASNTTGIHTIGGRLAIIEDDGNTTLPLTLTNEGAGDTGIRMNATSNTYCIGIDSDDSDKFKISDHFALGTNDRLTIDSSGNTSFSGHITASGDISSSGTITAASFNSIDTSLSFNHITASGNISSSGTGTNFFAGNVKFDGDTTISTVGGSDDISINPDAELNLGTGGSDEINIGRQDGSCDINMFANTSTVAARFIKSTITFNHPITASQNISASGDILTSENLITLGNISGSITSTGSFGSIEARGPITTLSNINVNGNITFDNASAINFPHEAGSTDTRIVGLNGLLNIEAKEAIYIDSDTDTIRVTGHITASGEISASDRVIAKRFNADGDLEGAGGYAFRGRDDTGIYESGFTVGIVAPENVQINIDANANDTSPPSRFVIVHNNEAVTQTPTNTLFEVFEDGRTHFTTGSITGSTINHSSGDFFTKGNITASGNISGSITSTGSFGHGFFDGKVGIGTTTPQNPLSVSGSMSVFNPNQTSRLTVGEEDDSVESTHNCMHIETAGANNRSRIFTTGTSNDMVIESMGNNSDIHLSSDRDIRFGVNNNSAYNFTEKMIMSSSGNFGIGTSTPGEKLQVEGNISASGTITADIFSTSAITINGLYDVSNRLRISCSNDIIIDSGDDIIFKSEGTEIVHIRGDEAILEVEGNIDLDGTLDVASHITASGNISSSGGVSTFGEVVKLVGEDPRLKLYADAGDHPGFELYDGTTRKWIIYNDPDDSHNLNIKDDGNDRVSITQTGKVGIGKTGPTKMLEVAGDISASGYISTLSHITASGNISASGEIYGKQTHFMHHAYIEDQDDGENFIPMGGTLIEVNATQFYNKMIAPYDGEIKKVWLNAENDPGNTTVKFYKNGSAVAKQVIADGSIGTDSIVFDILNTTVSLGGAAADRTFSAGDVLQISIDPANAIGEVQVTSVWEYTIGT